ncbi:putative porin [Bradyrhizobium sp. R2.2-H]|jgi:hypothetical protein|uniref:putative porin n=1 Tax=unclassified Bradyrhizobium TaxID=2631580 RepID=UPI0010493A46|nr:MULTISPECIES: putative porin [unclassified Bradyrhizobium]TCU76719.1 putative porin [Bradyrhizobium sp. Y-H1]TCU79792.1 putative porin [Bradyrhizobium sp. R2.2-H]
MWRELKTRELATTALMLVACAAPAAAQDDSPAQGKRPTVSRAAPPSSNATVNLINLLVKQGTLSEEQAAALIKQADDEAYVARQATRDAAAKADSAEKKATGAADAVSPPGTKRVTYVPEIVRKQLREEIRAEVMDRAHKEGWASPGALPEWISRIRWYGDVRIRQESDFFPTGNAVGYFPNFNAINTGNPFDVSNISNPNTYPSYNADQDRHRQRLRARIGLEAQLFDGFSSGIRIATGENSGPVSFNQTMGGSGGNFSKYAIWLDRAYIKYSPTNDMTFSAGRFDNPFFTATDLVYHRDLGFDGFAAQGRYEVMPGVTPFVVAGAFPIYNTAFDVGAQVGSDGSSATFSKLPSRDKWMFGAQVGGNFRPDPEIELTVGAAFYDFTNVQGKISSNCYVYTVQDLCDTDLTRPSFAQKGNTYIPLRSIVPTAFNDLGTQFLYQYFGLASAFQNVDLSARLDLGHFNPIHIIIDGEYVRNVAWNRDDIAMKLAGAGTILPSNGLIPLGAIAPCPGLPCTQQYAGGNQGWLARLSVGHRELKQLWDWNAYVGYKYLESDAVLDAFADSDFGLGGTNLKGYFIGGNVALSSNVWLTTRWMSANQIAGAPYAVDIFQFDLNARF